MNVPLASEGETLFAREEDAQTWLNNHITKSVHHLTGNTYSNDYDLVKADVSSDEHGKVMSLLFCRMLKYYEIRKAKSSSVEYPIFVDYYYERGWLIIRYKSRASLYDVMPDGTALEECLRHPVSINEEVNKIIQRIKHILYLSDSDIHIASLKIQSTFFALLDKYTHTPSEIIRVMEQNTEGIRQISEMIMHICGLPIPYQQKVDTDIRNLTEKYLSITWPDKNIFIKDREAYPTRLSATDEEDSRVDQSAATIDDPLQSKEVFFDNKRMLYNQKRCDGLTLVWTRKDRTYYSEPTYPVRFSEKGGACTLSFKKYVAEEDIQNVLFTIIDS